MVTLSSVQRDNIMLILVMSTVPFSIYADEFEVTGRGRPVAVLAPLPESTPLAGLVAGGRLRPAVHDRRRFPAPVAAGTV